MRRYTWNILQWNKDDIKAGKRAMETTLCGWCVVLAVAQCVNGWCCCEWIKLLILLNLTKINNFLKLSLCKLN